MAEVTRAAEWPLVVDAHAHPGAGEPQDIAEGYAPPTIHIIGKSSLDYSLNATGQQRVTLVAARRTRFQGAPAPGEEPAMRERQ